MKKLSVVLAIVLALSCFAMFASAANYNVTLTAKGGETADVVFTQAEGKVADKDILAKATVVKGYEAVAVEKDNVVLKEVDITEDTTLTVVYAKIPTITITVNFKANENVYKEQPAEGGKVDGNPYVPAPITIEYTGKAGTTLKAADILAAVKEDPKFKEAVARGVITLEEVVDETAPVAEKNFKSVELENDTAYAFDTYATVASVENLATVLGTELGKINWGSIANANVSVINQIIAGSKAAIESLVNADWPDAGKKAEEPAANADAPAADAATETPNTGVGAVAGAAVIVLALSATTAVVLRKKED